MCISPPALHSGNRNGTGIDSVPRRNNKLTFRSSIFRSENGQEETFTYRMNPDESDNLKAGIRRIDPRKMPAISESLIEYLQRVLVNSAVLYHEFHMISTDHVDVFERIAIHDNDIRIGPFFDHTQRSVLVRVHAPAPAKYLSRV